MPRKERIGNVVSDKMDKTCVVAIIERTSHVRYSKVHVVTTKFKAHDPENTAKHGDRVRIRESRPYSKDKTWELVEVLKHTEEV